MKMPSAESMRRSRRATSVTSPISTPSTNTMPSVSCAPKRAPLLVDLQREAVLAAEDPLRRDADGLGELAVQPHALVVAVRPA